jgi:hypothetical protein
MQTGVPMRARVIAVAALGLFLTLSASPRILAQDCNQILEHGIFNTTTTDSLSNRTHTLINWLSQSTLDTYEHATDSAAKLGFSLDGLPAELGGHSKEHDWHNYQSSLQTLNFDDQYTLDLFKQTLVSADKGIVEAWTTCIVNIQGVAHAVIESSYDPTVFTIKLIYQSKGKPYTATISDFSISPSTVKCSPTIHTWWPFQSEIDSANILLKCTRQSAADAVQMTGNTSRGDVSAKLPGLTPRAVTPNGDPVQINNLVVVTAENVPMDFKPKNTGRQSGCSCNGAEVYFPDGPYNVKVNEEFLFRYDASVVWHAQGFDNFHGVVNWGPASTTLHDLQPPNYWGILGTLKVKFSKIGDYNVVVDLHANCLDAFYNCSNTCPARGTTEVHVK